MALRRDDFHYTLPPELIAQEPAPQREASRLMVLDRRDGSINHTRFSRIGDYLRPGDLLVANRSKVIPARLHARKPSGGAVELLLLSPLEPTRWLAMARPSRRLAPGLQLEILGSCLSALLESKTEDGRWIARFGGSPDVPESLRRAGTLPLPPYIRNPQAPLDRYQTVYADRDGSVAAPTAGLHFSQQLLASLAARGVEARFVTLHVGPGTFKPVSVYRLQDHRMHPEWGEIPEAVATDLNETRAAGGRLVAVGTTTTRLLESAVQDGKVRPFHGETDRFIYPPYRFGAVDALVTNFHLPCSTLLMLVSAFAGRELVLAAYQEAVRLRYRFYSFGDAMLIL